MLILKQADDLTKFVISKRNAGNKIGFVPTMGALHQGHISLINKSKNENSLTVCSIFVNPKQFTNPEDFEKYPITIESDIEMLETAGCDVLFLPSVEEIYPVSFQKIHYDLGEVENILEGKYRPGHFQGVCLVVERLLRIVQCNTMYLGQKDYQQCIVINKMVELQNINVEIIIAPTIRESTGLAMSSRNRRLNENEKTKSLSIYNALTFLKSNLSKGDLHLLKNEATSMLIAAGFDVDYVEITDNNLTILENWDGQTNAVGLIAATINQIRLIDNLILS